MFCATSLMVLFVGQILDFHKSGVFYPEAHAVTLWFENGNFGVGFFFFGLLLTWEISNDLYPISVLIPPSLSVCCL